MVQRLVYRRRLSYNTKSNRRRIVRTPGGRLVYQYLKKPKRIPRCGQCKDKLRGIIPARPMERARICRRKQTVKRAYGGVLCHKCVKERYLILDICFCRSLTTAILKASLIEEFSVNHSDSSISFINLVQLRKNFITSSSSRRALY